MSKVKVLGKAKPSVAKVATVADNLDKNIAKVIKKKSRKVTILKKEDERVKELKKLDDENHQALSNLPNLIVIESGYGYALVAIHKKLAIYHNIEKGAGFQPYETTIDKEIVRLELFQWSSSVEYDDLSRSIVKKWPRIVTPVAYVVEFLNSGVFK